MEPQKKLPPDHQKYAMQPDDSMDQIFEKAHRFTAEYYRDTIDRISHTTLDQVTADEMFREVMWVVHATGFSSHAVTKFMPRLQAAWGPVLSIPAVFEESWTKVQPVCNNPQKAKALHTISQQIQAAHKAGEWQEWKQTNCTTLEALAGLPYIGKVTACHLARNIGNLEVIKPDLHLVRMAKHFEEESAESMVRKMSEQVGIKPGIADLSLWYYLSTFGSLQFRKEGER